MNKTLMIVVIIILLAAGYFFFFNSESTGVDLPTDDGEETALMEDGVMDDTGDVGEAVQIANPASVHCVDNGGTVAIMDGESGQYGVCTFEDGSTCEEWAFFRGECAPGENVGVGAVAPDKEEIE